MYNVMVIVGGVALSLGLSFVSVTVFEPPVSILVSFIGGLGIGACVPFFIEI